MTITPSQLAERYGVDVHKILAWIHAGELAAVNLAERPDRRPRYRITQEAIEAFERRRTVGSAPKPERRRRQRDARVIAFV